MNTEKLKKLASPGRPLTKELLLECLSQEEIFQRYLYVSNFKESIRSPFRDDKTPGCKFYKNSAGVLYLNDFATRKSYDCFGTVQALFSLNFFEALQRISMDFGLGLGQVQMAKATFERPDSIIVPVEMKVEENPTSIQVKARKYTEQDYKWWGERGVSKDSLKKYKVFCVQDLFVNGKLVAQSRGPHNPIYCYDFGSEIKVYQPNSARYKWCGNARTTIQGWEQFKADTEGKSYQYCVISKSLKDVMVLNTIGVRSFAMQTEAQTIPNEVLEFLQSNFQEVFLFYDNDSPGVAFAESHMESIQARFPNLKIKNIQIDPLEGCKDPSEMAQKKGLEYFTTYFFKLLFEYDTNSI